MFDVAVAVAVERALVLRDAEANGFMRQTAADLLDRRGRETTVGVALSAAPAAYARTLTLKRPAPREDVREGLLVPVATRLIDRARTIDRLAAIDIAHDDLRSALAWERAAMLNARTMSEWALSVLAFPSQPHRAAARTRDGTSR